MKTTPWYLALLTAILPPGLRAGEIIPADPAGVRLSQGILDGSEAAPTPEKPRLRIAAKDILSSRVTRDGQRSITVRKVTPILLPPPTEAAAPAGIDPATLAQRLAARAAAKTRQTIHFGGSVYVSRDRPQDTRTHLQYYPAPGAPPIGIWTNLPFQQLAGSFAEFETDARRYSLMMMLTEIDIDRPSKMSNAFRADLTAGKIPGFSDPAPAYLVSEGNPTAEQLAPLEALVKLHSIHKDEIAATYESRQRANAARALELKNNPPEKKNIVLKYWRLDAAGQAGTSPKPAVIR